ncbi:hypothetical protein EO087_02500 [Dyella sp. M7H15-1]|nr:hypothetical protein EO087_02500 [Dyella sp. M7H15-1]
MVQLNFVGVGFGCPGRGADRVELCSSLAEGGITPSYGLLAVARDRVRIPVYALVRPRGGDFLYDDAEFEIMRRDIETCVQLGFDGVVIGALDADGGVDPRCRALVAAAGRLGVTFHRAIDASADMSTVFTQKSRRFRRLSMPTLAKP